MFTIKELEIINDAQEQQLMNPANSGVNSESRFVKDKIAKIDVDLANRYWSNVCFRKSFESNEVDENESKLKAIDDKGRIPAWGIKGT